MFNTTISTRLFTYNQMTQTFIGELSSLKGYDLSKIIYLKSQVTGRTMKFKTDGQYISPKGVTSIEYVSRCENYRIVITK